MENMQRIKAPNECLRRPSSFDLSETCSLRTERVVGEEHGVSNESVFALNPASFANHSVSKIHSSFTLPSIIRSKRRFDSCSSANDPDLKTPKVSFIYSSALKQETINSILSCKKPRKRSKKLIKLSSTSCFGDESLGTTCAEHRSLKYDKSSAYIKECSKSGKNTHTSEVSKNYIPIWKTEFPASPRSNDPYDFPPSPHLENKSKLMGDSSPHLISSQKSVSIMNTSYNADQCKTELVVGEERFEDRNHDVKMIVDPSLDASRSSVDIKITHKRDAASKHSVTLSESSGFSCSGNYMVMENEKLSIKANQESIPKESLEYNLTPILIGCLRRKPKLKNGLPLSSMERSGRRVRFDSVKVFYFGRCQGGVTVPKNGEITLAMLNEHFTQRHFSLCSGRRPDLTLFPCTEGDLSEGEISGEVFDPIEFERSTTASICEIEWKLRVKLLKRSGVRIQKWPEKLESIRQSRIECGCNCTGGNCLPELCQCYKDGIKCQVDGQAHDGSGNTHPCWCSAYTCSNPMGRVEFDPERVKIHYITTIKRIKDMERTGIYGSPLVIKFEDSAQTQYSYCPTPPPAAYLVSSNEEKETLQQQTSPSLSSSVASSYFTCSFAEDLTVPKYPVTPTYQKTSNQRSEGFLTVSNNPITILEEQKSTDTMEYEGKEELKVEEN